MSHLKALVSFYTSKDQSVPVEFYSVTGTLLRGSIQRLEDDVAVIVQGNAEVIRRKIQVKGTAGAANPQEWCLTREAFTRYTEIAQTGKIDLGAARRTQIYDAFGELLKNGNDVNFHFVQQWPNVMNEDVAGFVSLNIHAVDEPLAGFLVLRSGATRFIHALPADVKLSPM
jgi:hypothetical protein